MDSNLSLTDLLIEAGYLHTNSTIRFNSINYEPQENELTDKNGTLNLSLHYHNQRTQ